VDRKKGRRPINLLMYREKKRVALRKMHGKTVSPGVRWVLGKKRKLNQRRSARKPKFGVQAQGERGGGGLKIRKKWCRKEKILSTQKGAKANLKNTPPTRETKKEKQARIFKKKGIARRIKGKTQQEKPDLKEGPQNPTVRGKATKIDTS